MRSRERRTDTSPVEEGKQEYGSKVLDQNIRAYEMVKWSLPKAVVGGRLYRGVMKPSPFKSVALNAHVGMRFRYTSRNRMGKREITALGLTNKCDEPRAV